MVNERSEGLPLVPWTEPSRPTRHRIVETSLVAFAERGYHGASVRDISRSAGVTVGTFYTHFGSKETVLFELMHRGHEAHQTCVRDALLGTGPEPADQLRAAISANVAFHATYPFLTIVGNSELHALDAGHRDVIFELRHAAGQLVAAVIDRGRQTGAFDCDDTWLAMSAIAGMGVRVAWWFRPPELLGAESPTSSYPSRAASWLPTGDYDAGVIADAYAEFALRIVGSRR